jgi:hypothetical protein
VNPITSGPAFRVTIVGAQQSESYPNVRAVLDSEYGVVHVFSVDGARHYLSVPLGMALVEWADPAPLKPEPRIPPYGPGAYTRLAEQAQRFAEGFFSQQQGAGQP